MGSSRLPPGARGGFMQTLVVGLVVLVCVLAIITVVGHGIWVMLASIFGSGTAPPVRPDAGPRRRRTCPGCGGRLLPIDRDCPRCGLDQDSRLAAQVERVRFAERAEIEPAAAQQVIDRLSGRIRALLGERTTAAPLPRAVPVGPAPLDLP